MGDGVADDLDDLDEWARLAAEAIMASRRTADPSEAAALRAEADFYIAQIAAAGEAVVQVPPTKH